jgi:hypothetical protein
LLKWKQITGEIPVLTVCDTAKVVSGIMKEVGFGKHCYFSLQYLKKYYKVLFTIVYCRAFCRVKVLLFFEGYFKFCNESSGLSISLKAAIGK